MMRRLFAPLTPSDALREERERVERRKPHLALARFEPKPAPKPERDVYAWVSVEDLLP